MIIRSYANQEVPDHYLPSLADTLSYLTDTELAWVLHPREGVATRCKFPPNPAEVHELVRERAAKLEAVMATRSMQYRYFDGEEPDPRPASFEERKATVIRQLGYDPAEAKKWNGEPVFETSKVFRSSNDLKTPAAPISPEMLALLMNQGIVPREPRKRPTPPEMLNVAPERPPPGIDKAALIRSHDEANPPA